MTPERAKELLPIIQAFVEGRTIQNRVKGCTVWKDVPYPCWDNECEYRVKPETIKYRVALLRDATGYQWAHCFKPHPLSAIAQAGGDLKPENLPNFVKWLTDWIEVEV